MYEVHTTNIVLAIALSYTMTYPMSDVILFCIHPTLQASVIFTVYHEKEFHNYFTPCPCNLREQEATRKVRKLMTHSHTEVSRTWRARIFRQETKCDGRTLWRKTAFLVAVFLMELDKCFQCSHTEVPTFLACALLNSALTLFGCSSSAAFVSASASSNYQAAMVSVKVEFRDAQALKST